MSVTPLVAFARRRHLSPHRGEMVEIFRLPRVHRQIQGKEVKYLQFKNLRREVRAYTRIRVHYARIRDAYAYAYAYACAHSCAHAYVAAFLSCVYEHGMRTRITTRPRTTHTRAADYLVRVYALNALVRMRIRDYPRIYAYMRLYA
jgi:hypothetical protein